MSDDPYAKVQWDGKTLDRITAEALHATEKILGYELTVVQGSYNAGGVAASGGTHDAGGAVDLMPFDHDNKVRALRRVGFAAWYRPELVRDGKRIWGSHIHAILIGNEKLSPAAAAQVDDYRRGLNGLADHAPDPTWRPNPIPMFKWPPVMTRGAGVDALIKATRERLRAVPEKSLRARMLRASLTSLLAIPQRPKS